MSKRIVLITTGQPAVNPRIVKEANLFAEEGYEVTLLYSYWIEWANDVDKSIISNAKWRNILVGGTPHKQRFKYWISRIKHKIYKILNVYLGNIFDVPENVQARTYRSLLKTAKSIKADWFIGHNLGALPIAVKAAEYHNANAAFDFEDYHRSEIKAMLKSDINRITFLEEKYLNKVNYISTSSPLITRKVKNNFQHLKIPIITILNVFPRQNQLEFKSKNKNETNIQLFWFSQTIGENRGLESVLEAMSLLGDESIHFTLVGRCTPEVRKQFLAIVGNLAKNIHFLGTVSPHEIEKIASTMHIGLALEEKSPLNRDICLTNKLFTYIQAGNAIILTDTNAQADFQLKYNVGILCKSNSSEDICKALLKFKRDPELLETYRIKNWQLANKELNWEVESKEILNLIHYY